MSRFNVVVTNDAKMRQYKKQWFGIDEVTDVISFATQKMTKDQSASWRTNDQLEGSQDLVGEIVVNEDQVRRNAAEYGVSFEQEMARVVAHGVLHVYGYTDDTDEGRLAMKAIEDEIVSGI